MARKKKPALVEVAVHQDSHSDGELIAHETYDHVFYLEDDPETLLNEDGIPVKLDDNGEPIIDEETGLPKIRKARKPQGEKTAPSKPRKVRIIPNLKQQSRLPLPGFMSFSRVMLDSGDFVRVMAWGRIVVRQLLPVTLEPLLSLLGKEPKVYQDRFREFVRDHYELGQSYPLTDFRLVQAVLDDDSLTWAVAFPETVQGKGISLQKILHALGGKPKHAAKSKLGTKPAPVKKKAKKPAKKKSK